MNWRLFVAVATTLLDDVLIFVLIWFGLPFLGIHLPLVVLITLSILWTLFAIIVYRAGTRALRRKPIKGLTDMTDMQGTALKDLSPAGMIKIKGEIWEAASTGEEIHAGEKVIVVSQAGLMLTVRRIK